MLYIFTVFQLSQYCSINFLCFELIIDSHCMYTLYPVYPSGNNILYGLPVWLSGKESTCSAGDARDMVPSLGQEDPLE